MPSLPQTFDIPHGEITYETLARIWGRQWTSAMQIVNASLKIDTAANRSTTPLFDESLFYASDTGVLTVGSAGVWEPVKADVITTANLPAAGSTQDGRIVIEDAGVGDRNLIVYAGGQRFRIDGGVAF